jgi:glycopeptide antibiotics resistance protein
MKFFAVPTERLDDAIFSFLCALLLLQTLILFPTSLKAVSEPKNKLNLVFFLLACIAFTTAAILNGLQDPYRVGTLIWVIIFALNVSLMNRVFHIYSVQKAKKKSTTSETESEGPTA